MTSSLLSCPLPPVKRRMRRPDRERPPSRSFGGAPSGGPAQSRTSAAVSMATVTITATAAGWAVAMDELISAATIAIREFEAPLRPRPPVLDAGAHSSGGAAGTRPPLAPGLFRPAGWQEAAGLISSRSTTGAPFAHGISASNHLGAFDGPPVKVPAEKPWRSVGRIRMPGATRAQIRHFGARDTRPNLPGINP